MPRRSRVSGPLLVLAAPLLFGSAACSTAAPADLAPPEQAETSMPEGTWEATTRIVVSALLNEVGGDQDFEYEWYRVPVDLEWDAVTAYYADELGDGWSRDDAVPEEGVNALRGVWTEDGPLDNATVAIALVTDPVPGFEPQFHVLVVATSE